MGRPLSKDANGTDVRGNISGEHTGITVVFHDGTAVQTDGFIVKQRGAKTFMVSRPVTEGSPFRHTCVLVNSATPEAGQMRIFGYVGQEGAVANEVSIAKFTKRIATDFTGARYLWKLENDSSANYIVLTPF